MDFDNKLQDDKHSNTLENKHSKKYNAMEKKSKAKRKEKKLKHAYKADAQIWKDKTCSWVKKLDRNRGSTCMLTMLFTEFNYVFDSEEGREKLKAEHMAAKKIYEKNEQKNNKHGRKYPDKYIKYPSFS